MALSYSSAASHAQPQAQPSASHNTTATPAAASSSAASSSRVTHLILDAGPLLSLAPLRHLASSFHTTPAVLAELRDPRAREHWDRLALAGVDVRVEQPSAEALRRVTEYAKRSGDFAVLSATDVGVVALTWMHEVAVNGEAKVRRVPGEVLPRRTAEGGEGVAGAEDALVDDGGAADGVEEVEDSDGEDEEELSHAAPDASGQAASDDDVAASVKALALDPAAAEAGDAPAGDGGDGDNDEDDESDGGDWITPGNVKSHRSHDLGLLPSGDSDDVRLAAACMTGDYAVQNVLLGMGLGLVGEGGKRISQVRSWVLRCHACFKLCKDSSKRFCPSCGNATLLRATVTTSSETGKQTVHLRRNFQYHLRGTKFSIPEPVAGRAKGQQKGGSGLILREDQAEWQDAVRGDRIRREKEERRAAKGVGGWDDPDMVTVGVSGKGRSGGHGMPSIGHGRKNPNQARKKR